MWFQKLCALFMHAIVSSFLPFSPFTLWHLLDIQDSLTHPLLWKIFHRIFNWFVYSLSFKKALRNTHMFVRSHWKYLFMCQSQPLAQRPLWPATYFWMTEELKMFFVFCFFTFLNCHILSDYTHAYRISSILPLDIQCLKYLCSGPLQKSSYLCTRP